MTAIKILTLINGADKLASAAAGLFDYEIAPEVEDNVSDTLGISGISTAAAGFLLDKLGFYAAPHGSAAATTYIVGYAGAAGMKATFVSGTLGFMGAAVAFLTTPVVMGTAAVIGVTEAGCHYYKNYY